MFEVEIERFPAFESVVDRFAEGALWKLPRMFDIQDPLYFFQLRGGVFLAVGGAVEFRLVAQLAFDPIKPCNEFYDFLGDGVAGDFDELAAGMRPAGGMGYSPTDHSSDSRSASIPGPRMISGTRMPPSESVPLPPASGRFCA